MVDILIDLLKRHNSKIGSVSAMNHEQGDLDILIDKGFLEDLGGDLYRVLEKTVHALIPAQIYSTPLTAMVFRSQARLTYMISQFYFGFAFCLSIIKSSHTLIGIRSGRHVQYGASFWFDGLGMGGEVRAKVNTDTALHSGIGQTCFLPYFI